MKKLQNQVATSAEELFAQRVSARLEESLAQIPQERLERLAFARKLALRAQPAPKRVVSRLAQPSLAFAGRGMSLPTGGRGRVGLGLALAVLVLTCLFGMFEIEQQRRIEDLADIDSALLTDDLPISAYADHGFNAYLKQNP